MLHFSNLNSEMETGNHSKNGAGWKSQKGRGNFLMKACFAVWTVVLTLSVGLTSCSQDDEDTIVGTWELIEINGSKEGVEGQTFTFRRDGKFLWESDDRDSYVLKDKVIYFTYVPADQVIWGDTWKIVSLKRKELVADIVFNINPSDNARVKLKKISD